MIRLKSPTLLDRSETTVDPAASSDPPRWAIDAASEHPHRSLHRDNAGARIAIIAAMLTDPDAAVRKRAWKMRDCRAYPVLYVTADGSLASMLGSCRDRACPTCAACRSRDVKQRIATGVADWHDIRFLTLTLDHRGETLDAMLDRLTASYRRLRQQRSWKQAVKGSIATIEVTRNTATGEWHAHAHVLVHGQYYPHAALRDSWTKASRGATIVRIERVNAHDAAAGYLAKYVSKPADIAAWPTHAISAWARATKGRRLLIVAGDAHGKCVSQRTKASPPEKNGKHVAWHTVLLAYNCRHPAAHALVASMEATAPGAWAYLQERADRHAASAPVPAEWHEASPARCIEALHRWHCGVYSEDIPPPRRPRQRIRAESTPYLYDHPPTVS